MITAPNYHASIGRSLLKNLALLGLLAATLAHSATTASPTSLTGRRPNIIVIIADDQGYGDLSCHGNPILKTPNIDRLHAEGVRFTDFHVSPTCAPTRAALMTGRHEFKNGVTHTVIERERLTLRAITLATVLKSAGYRTGIFGKWHLGDEPAHLPDRRGFDEMFIHGAGGIGQSYAGSCGDAPTNSYFDPVILHNGRFVKTSGYCTDVLFGQATRWMESQPRHVPFLAWIALNAPHAPLDVRPEDEARYASAPGGKLVPKFFGMIANIDDNVGRLLGKLREWEIEKDTLVVFITDNGGTVGVPLFNAGVRGAKGTPWLGGTRAASLWRWPGTLDPANCSAFTAHIDVLPTFAALAGVPLKGRVARQVEGRSLIPLFENPAATWQDRTIFTHVGRWPLHSDPNLAQYTMCAVRTGEWSMVSTNGGTAAQWQLFRRREDPTESKDLISSHPEVVQRLSSEYDTWWKSLQSRWVNEQVKAPTTNAFHVRYWRQLRQGGIPNLSATQ